MSEEAVKLGPYESLVGIYHGLPATGASEPETVVVMFNAGFIHHAGPHRLYVDLARALARGGIPSLRVDLSGIGDSSARPDGMPNSELIAREPIEIMDTLEQKYGHRRFVLFGICSGAVAALRAVAGDSRVRGLVLVNTDSPVEDSPGESASQMQYYLRHSLRNPQAWLNLVTGRVKYGMLFGSIWSTVKARLAGISNAQTKLADHVRRELQPAVSQQIRVLVVSSDRHAGFAQMLGDQLQDLEANGLLSMPVFPEADHLFTAPGDRRELIRLVCAWLAEADNDAELVA